MAHCYTTLYNLSCHFASNVPVFFFSSSISSNSTKCCLAIIQRDHRKLLRTSYSHFHDFLGPTPDSRTFWAWKMWLKFHDSSGSVQTCSTHKVNNADYLQDTKYGHQTKFWDQNVKSIKILEWAENQPKLMLWLSCHKFCYNCTSSPLLLTVVSSWCTRHVLAVTRTDGLTVTESALTVLAGWQE